MSLRLSYLNNNGSLFLLQTLASLTMLNLTYNVTIHKDDIIMDEEFGIPAPEEQQGTVAAVEVPTDGDNAAPSLQGEANVNMTPAPPPDRDIENVISRQRELLDALTKNVPMFTPSQEAVLKADKEKQYSQLVYNKKGSSSSDADAGADADVGDPSSIPKSEYDQNKDKVAQATSDADFEKMRADGIKLSVDLQDQLDNVTNAENRHLLERLSYAESSGGKFRIHENAGSSRALGSFGLLPSQAIGEVVRVGKGNFKELFEEEYREIQNAVANKDWPTVSKMTANPVFDAVLAEDYLNILKTQIKYNTIPESYRDDALLFAWYKGRGGLNSFVKVKGYEALAQQGHVKRANIPD